MKFYWKLIVIAFLFQQSTYAAVGHTKLWGTSVFIGNLIPNTNIKYYFEPQLRFIDNRYKFEDAFLLAGFGYQLKPNFIVFLGATAVVSKRADGTTVHEKRIWQQINWNTTFAETKVLTRTRLEERANSLGSDWNIRLRERVMGRFPIKSWNNHALVLFDEVFINFNKPSWARDQATFSQNRAFIGLGTQLNKNTNFDIGYLNQYQFGKRNQLSNVLFLNLSVTT